MEKQVNKFQSKKMLNKGIKTLLTLIFIGSFNTIVAQEIKFENGKEYILAIHPDYFSTEFAKNAIELRFGDTLLFSFLKNLT